MTEPEQPLLVERRAGVVQVTFNRPEKRNAIDREMWATLDRVLTEVGSSAADRVLVLTGAGGHFSAGADLSGASSREAGDRPFTLERARAINEIVRRLERLAKPTLAVVDGVAIGVALGLALACDLVVASEGARFGAVFSKRGLTLDGGTSWTLPRQIGLRRAKQLALLAEPIDAGTALDWGLVSRVVPRAELAAAAGEWAEQLAAGPTIALGLTKHLLDESGALSFERALDAEAFAQHAAFSADDLQEGLLAFRERRPPSFTGN